MGEGLPTEGAKLSGAHKSGTVCGHNSGESLKWAPKVHGTDRYNTINHHWNVSYESIPYLSGQRTELIVNCYNQVIRGNVYITRGDTFAFYTFAFYCLYRLPYHAGRLQPGVTSHHSNDFVCTRVYSIFRCFFITKNTLLFPTI